MSKEQEIVELTEAILQDETNNETSEDMALLQAVATVEAHLVFAKEWDRQANAQWWTHARGVYMSYSTIETLRG